MSILPGTPGPYFLRQANARNCPLGDHEGDTAYPVSVNRSVLVPSASIKNICGNPVRALTKAICAPVLGLNAGETFAPMKAVTRFKLFPEPSERNISGVPRMEEENASFVPSADHAGETFVPSKRGKLT